MARTEHIGEGVLCALSMSHSVCAEVLVPASQAQKIRTRLMTHYKRIFYEKDVDYVATPTTGTTAPIIRWMRPSSLHSICLGHDIVFTALKISGITPWQSMQWQQLAPLASSLLPRHTAHVRLAGYRWYVEVRA